MEVKVEVEEDTVTFRLREKGWFKTAAKVYIISSPILSRPWSEFVPFIQMAQEGDTV